MLGGPKPGGGGGGHGAEGGYATRHSSKAVFWRRHGAEGGRATRHSSNAVFWRRHVKRSRAVRYDTTFRSLLNSRRPCAATALKASKKVRRDCLRRIRWRTTSALARRLILAVAALRCRSPEERAIWGRCRFPSFELCLIKGSRGVFLWPLGGEPLLPPSRCCPRRARRNRQRRPPGGPEGTLRSAPGARLPLGAPGGAARRSRA